MEIYELEGSPEFEEKPEVVTKEVMEPVYFFNYNLDTGRPHEEGDGEAHAVKYGYKNTVVIGSPIAWLSVPPMYWNLIIGIIANDDLDRTGIEAILCGFLHSYLGPGDAKLEKACDNLIAGIKEGNIPKYELPIAP